MHLGELNWRYSGGMGQKCFCLTCRNRDLLLFPKLLQNIMVSCGLGGLVHSNACVSLSWFNPATLLTQGETMAMQSLKVSSAAGPATKGSSEIIPGHNEASLSQTVMTRDWFCMISLSLHHINQSSWWAIPCLPGNGRQPRSLLQAFNAVLPWGGAAQDCLLDVYPCPWQGCGN